MSCIYTALFLKFINLLNIIMARVTVEDCVLNVPNRFELCLVASNRAKSILSGAATDLDRKEKPAVISLREIADNTVDVELLRTNIIRGIKNRGSSNYDSAAEVGKVVVEEVEDQELELKDNTFVDDNIEVDD
ncbi:MAG: DNA-directed RNA polymerase subunit omega [Lentimonas sp.]|jgi:DNA-directed RNA polymerase subunit omega